MVESRPYARAQARLRALSESRASTMVAGLLVALVTWPVMSSGDYTGLDPSWRAALHLAASDRLQWGSEIVFTFGPLGFLGVPWPFYGPTSALALVFSTAVAVGLAVLAVHILRRSMPLPVAFVVAYLVVRAMFILPAAEQFFVLVLIVCVELLRAERPIGGRLSIALGMVVGFGCLLKLSVAIGVGAVVAFTVLAAKRRASDVVVFAAAAGVAFLVGWLATSQSLAGIAGYVRGAYEVVSGYNASMGRPLTADRQWQPLAVGLAWAVVLGGAVLASRSWPRARRLGLLAVLAAVLIIEWKLVVRPFPTYVAAMGVGALIPFLGAFRRREVALVLGLALAVFLGVTAVPPEAFFNPLQSVSTAVRQWYVAVRVDRWETRAEDTRKKMREQLGIPDAVLARLSGQTVHVDPFEADVAMAYPSLAWRPMPIFQSYEANTTALDRMNADLLASDRAPTTILREYNTDPAMTIHGRFRWFESPAATLEMLCRYREGLVTEHWEVLERGADRCGAPVPLGTVRVPIGTPVTVPFSGSSGMIVVARVTGLVDSLGEQLRTLLIRGRDWYIGLDERSPYSIVAATAANRLILSVPSSIDYSGPYAFGPAVHEVAIADGHPIRPRGGQMTYEFVGIPVGATPNP